MGDPACWLADTCPTCGRLLEGEQRHATRCPRCGGGLGGPAVQIERRHLVDFFASRGDLETAERLEQALPDPVDLRQHAAALRELGIDAGLLATQITNLEP